MKRIFTCFSALAAILCLSASASAEVKTLYSWESPEGVVIEEGGYAMFFNAPEDAADRVNYANADYYTLCLNGKKANMNDDEPSDKSGQIVIQFNEGIQAGDTIYVTAYKNKGSEAKASVYFQFDDFLTGGPMGTLAGSDSFNDIKDTGLQPNTVAYIVPEGVAYCYQMRMTRNDAGTNLFITKLVIKGEREEQEPGSSENYYLNSVDNLVLDAEALESGLFNVKVSFVAPTKMSDDDWNTLDIDSLTAIKVFRSNDPYGQEEGELVYTFEKPAPGAELSWTEENVPMGTWIYTVHAYMGNYSDDWGSSMDITLGELPADFEEEDFVVKQDPKDEHSIQLLVKVPSLNSDGEPLKMPITKIVVGELEYNGWMPTQKILDSETDAEILQAGEVIMFTVKNVKDGQHEYFANAFTAAGSNFTASRSIFVGYDKPGTVADIKVEKTENGILVSWSAPTESQNGGDMGAISDLTYTVLRGTGLYDTQADTIAKGIKELQFLDTPNFTSEKIFCYIIYASSAYGEGYPQMSEEVLDGPACPLPFAENFDVMTTGFPAAQNSWVKSHDGGMTGCAWNFGESGMVGTEDIKPHSGAGLLYAYHWSTWTLNQFSYFTSGHINFSEAQAPQMTLWIYENNLCADTATTNLRIQTSIDDVNFVDAKVIEVGKSANTGWAEVSVDLEAVKNQPKAQIRLTAEAIGKGCVSILVDDINIVANSSTAIESVAEAAKNTVFFNLNGQRQNAAQKGLQIMGGKAVMVK